MTVLPDPVGATSKILFLPLEKWCLIKIKGKKGWIQKKNLWGVYKSEIYKISFIQPLINLYWSLISKIALEIRKYFK